MAATAGSNLKQQNTGDHLMMAGIGFQVVCLLFFAAAVIWYVMRRRRAPDVPFSHEATDFLRNIRFRLFVYGFIAAYACIMIRCIYRLVEM
jgi:hypothetical protein